MLVAALIAGLASSAVAPSVARADETVRTNMEASLRARPGERAPTLAHLDEGQSVRVLGRQGRWLKVSVKGKVGWITRTQVDDAEPASSARAGGEKKRTSSAKARKKGWSSMDDEAVGADAVEGAEQDEEDAPAQEEEAVAAKDEPKAESKDADAEEKSADAEEEKGAKAKKVAAKPRKKAEKIAKGGEVVALRTTTVHSKPSKKSDEKWDADKGTKMTVVAISAEGDWVKVKDADGEKGWVASKDLQARGGDDDDSMAGDAIAGGDSDEMGDEGKGVRQTASPRGAMTVWAAANAGVLAKTQTYRSGGEGLRANYAINNIAPAVVGQLGLSRRFGQKLVLGGDASVAATVGGSGITVAGQDGALGWKSLQIDAHGDVGYMITPKYKVSARAGYHVSAVTVAYSDEAKLPSETLSGITVGAAFAAPRLTEKLGMHIGAEYLVGATLVQTENLNDGDTSTASVFFVNAGFDYQLTSGLSATMVYNMAYESFGWSGVNEREDSAANARRIDVQHIVGFGVAYAF